MNNIYILNSEVHLTKGITRSLALNGFNNKILLIPNNIYDILTSKFKLTDFESHMDFFDYLVDNQFIIKSVNSVHFDYIKSSSFEKLFDNLPSSNFLIDIDEKTNIDQLINRITEDKFNFEYAQLRFFDFDESRHSKLISLIDEKVNMGFEIVFKETIRNYQQVFEKHKSLYYLNFFNSGKNETIELNGMVIQFNTKAIKDESSCGRISPENFVYNLKNVISNQNCNSCLKNKFSIDREGNYKNCPSMKVDFGNVELLKIKTAINKFKKSNNYKISDISKDEIDDCKICEFRDVCTDCRAYRKEESIYSKPKLCNYEPSLGKWLTVLFILFINSYNFSQNICNQLVDDFGNVVSFVKIINHQSKSGSYTDIDGRFCIEYSSLSDSIVIYTGREYKPYSTTIQNLKKDTLFLIKNSNITVFEEVEIVFPKLYSLNEFSYKVGGATISLDEGGNLCSYIEDSQNYSGRIKRISFFLKSFSDEYKIIPSIYEHDIVTNSIGKKISIRNYEMGELIQKKWVTLVVLDTIFMPKNGFYVGFECIPKNNKIEFDVAKKKSSLSFGAYYQKAKDGDRTYFSSFRKPSDWFQFPQGSYDKRNLLNLAVTVEVVGNKKHIISSPLSLVREGKVKRLLKHKSQNNDLVLEQGTIEELFQSIIKVIEENDISMTIGISKIKKEDYDHYYIEVQNSQDQWLSKEEQDEYLVMWNSYLNNISSNNVTKIDENYYKIVFPNETKNQNELELFKIDEKWFLVPYYNKNN